MGEARKIAAILAADVVGFGRMASADEDRTLAQFPRLLIKQLANPHLEGRAAPGLANRDLNKDIARAKRKRSCDRTSALTASRSSDAAIPVFASAGPVVWASSPPQSVLDSRAPFSAPK
jgi:hypothetical protein